MFEYHSPQSVKRHQPSSQSATHSARGASSGSDSDEEPPVADEEPPVVVEEPPIAVEEPPITVEEPPIAVDEKHDDDEDDILSGLVAARPLHAEDHPIVISDDEDDDEPPIHPRLNSQESVYLWTKATELTRMRYYKCGKHGGNLCPDCRVHVRDWESFSTVHYGCACFMGTSKATVCNSSFN